MAFLTKIWRAIVSLLGFLIHWVTVNRAILVFRADILMLAKFEGSAQRLSRFLPLFPILWPLNMALESEIRSVSKLWAKKCWAVIFEVCSTKKWPKAAENAQNEYFFMDKKLNSNSQSLLVCLLRREIGWLHENEAQWNPNGIKKGNERGQEKEASGTWS